MDFGVLLYKINDIAKIATVGRMDCLENQHVTAKYHRFPKYLYPFTRKNVKRKM
jgi:argininosuccinate synthase